MILSNTQKRKIHNRRFDEMRVTKEYIKTEYVIFQKIIQQYRLYTNNQLRDYILHLFDRKMREEIKNGKDTNVPVRAYFIRKVIEYLCEYDRDKYWTDARIKHLKHKLGFTVELIIIIQYLENQILDKKYISSDKELNQNLIAGNILRVLLFEYLEKELLKIIALRKVFKIIKAVREILLYVDLGQRIDKEFNNYEYYKKQDWTKSLNFDKNDLTLQINQHIQPIQGIIKKIQQEIPEKSNYIDLYFQRIFLTNVSLFSLSTKLIIELLASPSEVVANMKNYATCYGLSLQVVNDNHDFVNKEKGEETVAKKSTDAFSDLRNTNITLPLLYHLDKGYKRIIYDYLETKDLKIIEDYSEQIHYEIIQSRAIRKSIRIGQLAKYHLNYKNKNTPYLIDLCQISNWNRFYTHFYQKGKTQNLSIMEKYPSEKMYNAIREAIFNIIGKNDLSFVTQNSITEGRNKIGSYVDISHIDLSKEQVEQLQPSINFINGEKVSEKCRTPQMIKEIDKEAKFGALSDYFKGIDNDEFKKSEKNIISTKYNIEQDIWLELPVSIENEILGAVLIILKDKDRSLYKKKKKLQSEINSIFRKKPN